MTIISTAISGAPAPPCSPAAVRLLIRIGRRDEGGDLVVRVRVRVFIIIVILIAIFLVLGFFPRVALDVINPAVTQTLHLLGVADPAPAFGAQNGSAK